MQLAWRAILAMAIRIGSRLRSGPLVPGWSWAVELRLVGLKAFLDAARSHPDPHARRHVEERLDPPLPRRLRGVMEVRSVTIAGMTVEKHMIRSGGVSVTPQATLLYFHGGAYLAGSAATHRRLVANLSWSIGAEAIVPNYRLAPQHQYPAALDDAALAYKEIVASGVRPERLVLAGDSAGGGLAAALLLRLRDSDEPMPAGAILLSPYADLEHTAPSIRANAATDYLPLGPPQPNVYYLGEHDPKDPYASPIYGDFTGLPPLLVFAGGREMIRDDAARLVQAAKRDGCEAVLHIAPDMYHVWPALLPNHPETMRTMALAAGFVQECVS